MDTPAGQALEIACDESGYEGERLIGSTTEVFAHGSVTLDTDTAAAFMQELRDRIRSPATEYKANHVLRSKHRAVLEWMLEPSSPLRGKASVFLIDKALYVLGKTVDLLVNGVSPVGLDADPRARAMTAVLYRDGPRTVGPDRWHDVLVASNNLLRARTDADGPPPVEAYVGLLDGLAVTSGELGDVLGRLRNGREHAQRLRDRLRADPETSTLDPLLPAIVAAVGFWGEGRRRVTVVHDQQNTLPYARIARLKALLAGPGGLAELTLADSFTNPPIQVADVLAGAVRKLATDALNGTDDPELTQRLAPYVDDASIWPAGAPGSGQPPDRLDWPGAAERPTLSG